MAVINNASGQKSNAKKVTYSLPEYEGEYVLKILSKREVVALLASIEPLSWIKRHDTLPDDLDTQDKLDAWADHLRDKLMQDLDLCQIIQDCIGAQLQAMQNQLNTLQSKLQEGGSQYPPGTPLPPSKSGENLAGPTNPTCDLDILWSEALAVPVYMNRLITDLLEKFEAATNDIELVEVVTQLPVIDELGGDAIVSYINFLQEALAENYLAQYTEEYEAKIAYDIWCKAQLNDCAITMDIIYEIFQERVYDRFGTPGEAISTLIDLIGYIAGEELDATIVCDAVMYLVAGGGILANVLLGVWGIDSLGVVIQLAKNDANDDWLVWQGVFGDCPPSDLFCVPATSDPISAPYSTEFVLNSGSSYTISPTGVWNGGAGPDYPATGKSETANELFLVPGANVYRMVFRVGEAGDWFGTDDTFVITPTETGILYVALNDIPGGYTDNSGEICILIELGA